MNYLRIAWSKPIDLTKAVYFALDFNSEKSVGQDFQENFRILEKFFITVDRALKCGVYGLCFTKNLQILRKLSLKTLPESRLVDICCRALYQISHVGSPPWYIKTSGPLQGWCLFHYARKLGYLVFVWRRKLHKKKP